LDKIKLEINATLAEEWGTDGEDGKPSEDWPYQLDYWGVVQGWTLYRFFDGKVARYAGYAADVGVISGPVADMTLEDLADEFRGGERMYELGPVELDAETKSANGAVPAQEERMAAVDALARKALGPDGEYERPYCADPATSQPRRGAGDRDGYQADRDWIPESQPRPAHMYRPGPASAGLTFGGLPDCRRVAKIAVAG
jgi:hypothetical protein